MIHMSGGYLGMGNAPLGPLRGSEGRFRGPVVHWDGAHRPV